MAITAVASVWSPIRHLHWGALCAAPPVTYRTRVVPATGHSDASSGSARPALAHSPPDVDADHLRQIDLRGLTPDDDNVALGEIPIPAQSDPIRARRQPQLHPDVPGRDLRHGRRQSRDIPPLDEVATCLSEPQCS
jgi:hypothetical protein